MIDVLVPEFDEFNRYQFVKYHTVKIKNRPDFHDVNKIGRILPGIPCGGIGRTPLADLLKDGTKSVQSFYDGRQRTRQLKGYNVMLKSLAQ